MDELREDVSRSVDRLAAMMQQSASLLNVQTQVPSTSARPTSALPPNSQQRYDIAPASQQQLSSYQNAGARMTQQPLRCYHCQEIGHFRRNCPYIQRRGWNDEALPSVAHSIAGDHSGDVPVYIKVKIGCQTHRCLLDSGCDATLIPARLVKIRDIRPTKQRCLAANGTSIPVLGWTSLKARIGKVSVDINGLVSEHIIDCMLGVDWLSDNNIIWDFSKGQIHLDGEIQQLESRRRTSHWCGRVILTEDVTVPPRSQLDINARAEFNEAVVNRVTSNVTSIPEQQQMSLLATDTRELKGGVLVARSLLPNRADNLPVRVMNVSQDPVVLPKNTVISSLEHVETISNQVTGQTSSPKESTEATAVIEDMMSRVDPDVSDECRVRLKDLLHRYSAVFSKNEWDLGWTNLVTHSIDVGDSKPIRQRMRRYPPSHLQAIDEHIDTMLKQGVVERCSSEYASNVVLAKKKNGTLRCCIDFRQLNDVTKKDAYPLPSTSQSLDSLSGCKWFSTVDLRSGYHQLSMDPADADKTAFITRRGIFRFRTMPFGLCNAVATFQRLMDLVLSGLNLDICLVYLDDVVIFSSTMEQHLERLELVFKRLLGANLKLKPSKCFLMQTKVTFLGHIVSSDGIATDPEKIKLVSDWPVPTTLKQLRGFLGLSGYYRRFVEDYAKKAAPLNNLMKKNRPFIWTDDCQLAFEELKLALTSPPVLALPNDKDMYILDTDAANLSIGCVLSQVQDGQERVIAYAGRMLSKNEVNYCVTRKELLAIVYFVKYFRQYLLGRHFIVRTDHAALNWLRHMDQPVGQNARWLEQLEEYQFTVQHRRGKRHDNADAVSRHPCLNKPTCTACHPKEVNCIAVTTSSRTEQGTIPVADGPADNASTDFDVTLLKQTAVEPINQGKQHLETAEPSLSPGQCDDRDLSESLTLGWSSEEIFTAQSNDSDIGPIVDLISSSSHKPTWKDVEFQSADVKSLWAEWERLSTKNGVLCRRWTQLHPGPVRWQIIVPRIYRKEFIRLAHPGITGGHLGRSKTEEQVKRRAYWPNWRTDVAREVKMCEECSQYHRGKAPKQTPLQPFGAGYPFELIAVDITGKHPTSTRGNRYIITVIDVFSKYAEAYPVRNHTAPVVARVLVDNFFSRYGTPLRLLTDRGAEFESQIFQELCRRMDIEKIRTTAYQPSTNGCVERFHRTLNSMLAKVVQKNQRNWDDCLPSVMAAYRASCHSSTSFSPNALVFGRENSAPIDVVLGDNFEEEQNYDDYNEYVEQLQGRLRQSYQLAREHLNVAAERRKRDYDVRVRPTQFLPGQWVWYLYPRRYVNRSPKWDRNYEGPFLVVKAIPPSDYVIQRSKRTQPIVVHANKLKLCHGPTPQSWIAEEQPHGQVDELDQRQLKEPSRHQRRKEMNGKNDGSRLTNDHMDKRSSRRRRPSVDQQLDFEDEEEPFFRRPRTARHRRPPARLQDYYC